MFFRRTAIALIIRPAFCLDLLAMSPFILNISDYSVLQTVTFSVYAPNFNQNLKREKYHKIEEKRMRTKQKIAEILLDIKDRRVQHITFYEKRLRFKCQRCAVFCCKLGGPKLSERDIQHLKQIRSNASEFLDIHGRLRDKEDGSCIFLKFDVEREVHECSVYDYRPALCRIYPFHVEKSSPNSYTLKLIPCCNGLNTKDGELVNENFIKINLLDALLDFSYAPKFY